MDSKIGENEPKLIKKSSNQKSCEKSVFSASKSEKKEPKTVKNEKSWVWRFLSTKIAKWIFFNVKSNAFVDNLFVIKMFIEFIKRKYVSFFLCTIFAEFIKRKYVIYFLT